MVAEHKLENLAQRRFWADRYYLGIHQIKDFHNRTTKEFMTPMDSAGLLTLARKARIGSWSRSFFTILKDVCGARG
jgi:hypothetical protein